MKKLLLLALVLLMAGMVNADMIANALDPSHITASPGEDGSGNTVLDRQGQFCGDWAFTLWALYAVNGAGVNAAGEHQTGDTGSMFMDSTSSGGAAPHPVDGWNRNYKSFVNAMFDDSYYLESLQVWNFNGVAARGFRNVDIHVSNDYGQTYTLLVDDIEFAAAPVSSDYTGFSVDIPDGYYTDVILSCTTNWGDNDWTGLSEVQFITPEPATMALLALGGLVLRRKR